MIPLTLRDKLPPKRKPDHWAPVGLTLGTALKSAALLLLVMTKLSAWVTSGSPSLSAVAHGFTVCAPASSLTV